MSVQVRCKKVEAVAVVGPNGGLLEVADLPPANTRRWVIRRKAEVISAVRGGLLSLEDALARYGLTEEEFDAWRGAFDRYGMAGLRTTSRRQGAPRRAIAAGAARC
jgi:hypothetical protein